MAVPRSGWPPGNVAILFLLLTFVNTCSAAIASWWVSDAYAPQVVVQNSTTGQLRYSLCNSVGTPVYNPNDADKSFDLTGYPPKNGTVLAGTGWYDEELNATWASVFYLTSGNSIKNVVCQCDMATGKFGTSVVFHISNSTVAPSIHSSSGLAMVNLGPDYGYRLYYHDANRLVHQLKYISVNSTLDVSPKGWVETGPVSQDPVSFALGAAFASPGTGLDNITVVAPRDDQNIEMARLDESTDWSISTFPQILNNNLTITNKTNSTSISINTTATPYTFRLPAWTGQPGSLALASDALTTRHVFYIGQDSALHQLSLVSSSSSNNNSSATSIPETWTLQPSQPTTAWPIADSPSAEFGLASGSQGSAEPGVSASSASVVRIYYMVQGQLTEIQFDGRAWLAAAAVPTVATAAQTDGDGLSAGARAGVGVGVSLGVVALVAVAGTVYWFWFHGRRERLGRGAEGGEEAAGGDGREMESVGSPVTIAEKETQEIEGQVVNELSSESRTVYEMPESPYSHYELPT